LTRAKTPAADAPARAPAPSKPSGYLVRSRILAESFLAIAPLLGLYEAGLAVSRSRVVNGADALVRQVFLLFGDAHATLAWRIAIAACFALSVFDVVRRRLPVYRDLPLIGLEGLAYGACLGPLALAIQSRVAPMLQAASGPAAEPTSVWLRAALSVGAGVYEEIVFRLLLLSALFALLVRISAVMESSRVLALTVAILLSALAFSAFHHVGFAGEPFAAGPFLFRTIAGVVLGVIFALRGLGVAVYTHAAYDLLLTFQ